MRARATRGAAPTTPPPDDAERTDLGIGREVLRAVRKIELATRRAVNAELAGRYHSVFKGQGMAFAEVRPYAPGDDVRHIDWNVSARHQEHGLFVKQFTEERELTVVLLVDLSRSGDFGTRGKKKRRRLAEAGALIAFSAIKNNDRVGLLLFTDEVELYLPPRKGRRHVLRVIREIIEARPRRTGTKISGALAYLSRVQKRRAVCFVLSDWLDRDWDRHLKIALARHDVVAVRVTDPAEHELPRLGLLEIEDAETGEVVLVDTESRRVRETFAQRQKTRHEAARRRLLQLGCDLIDLQTDRDLVAPLVGFFRARAARLRGAR
ncbi:MAG: DUF58 domain-containing protein [Deltaproteobacteria bacterium]|nr:DUF58 domain-containing protein [Deltaproteobacteria bacterium]